MLLSFTMAWQDVKELTENFKCTVNEAEIGIISLEEV